MKFILTILLCALTASGALVVESPYTAVTNFGTVAIHLHSVEATPTPDPAGNHTLASVARHYGNTNGFAAYVVTQHDFLSTNAVPSYANGLFIRGIEVTRTNHTLGLFTTNLVAGGYLNESASTPQQVINDIRGQGGIAVLAHPNYAAAGWTSSVIGLMTNYQYLEIFNAVVDANVGRSQGVAENTWDYVLSMGLRIWGCSAMDTHTNLLTNACNMVYLTETNETALKAALMAGNLTFGVNHMLRVDVTNDTVYVHTFGESSTIDWICNGATNKTTSTATSDFYNLSENEMLTRTNIGYVRVRATVTGDTNRIAWGQPIFYTLLPGRTASGLKFLLK